MNNCVFIGHFVHDPKLGTHTKSNISVTNFRLAIPERFKKGNGEPGSHTAFLDFEAWDSGAEVICAKFKKGDPIIIKAMAKSYRQDSGNNIVFRVEHFESPPRTPTQPTEDSDES